MVLLQGCQLMQSAPWKQKLLQAIWLHIHLRKWLYLKQTARKSEEENYISALLTLSYQFVKFENPSHQNK